jgi:hypothetical protein
MQPFHELTFCRGDFIAQKLSLDQMSMPSLSMSSYEFFVYQQGFLNS